jgi:hypothetical protein
MASVLHSHLQQRLLGTSRRVPDGWGVVGGIKGIAFLQAYSGIL